MNPATPAEPNPIDDIDVILPVYNEADCIREVVTEVLAVFDTLSERRAHVLLIDDGSTDETPTILAELAASDPRVRVFTQPENQGQSFAFARGFSESTASLLITMDADGQNDPGDIPEMLRKFERVGEVDAIFGIRRHRRDTWTKRWGSRLANRVRNFVLRENIVDTGCALKIFRRWLIEDLTPWDGMHRFFGSLFLMRRARIDQVPVNHRSRFAGESKYTNLGRLPKTVRDLWRVRRMKKNAAAKP